MKLDAISTLAEVMPYYGTLDKVYRLMGAMNIRTRKTWKEWRVQFGRIIKRNTIEIHRKSIIRYLLSCNNIHILILSLFKINEIYIKGIGDYQKFIEWIEKCTSINLIQIKDLYLYLSKKDNFNCSYENACSEIAYGEQDRRIDIEYNRLIESIEQLNLHIDNINSFLYSNELSNRNIRFVNRIIYIFGRDYPSIKLKEVKEIIKWKGIKVNKISILLNHDKAFKIEKKYSSVLSSLNDLKLDLIEVYVSSGFGETMISADYL